MRATELRVAEAIKMGFTTVVVPAVHRPGGTTPSLLSMTPSSLYDPLLFVAAPSFLCDPLLFV